MTEILEALGWLALGLNVWGNLALAKKSRLGWLIRLACNAAWVGYSVSFEVWPLLANHIIFSGINVYGWIQWSRSIYTCTCGREYDRGNHPAVCICEMPIMPFIRRERRS